MRTVATAKPDHAPIATPEEFHVHYVQKVVNNKDYTALAKLQHSKNAIHIMVDILDDACERADLAVVGFLISAVPLEYTVGTVDAATNKRAPCPFRTAYKLKDVLIMEMLLEKCTLENIGKWVGLIDPAMGYDSIRLRAVLPTRVKTPATRLLD